MNISKSLLLLCFIPSSAFCAERVLSLSEIADPIAVPHHILQEINSKFTDSHENESVISLYAQYRANLTCLAFQSSDEKTPCLSATEEDYVFIEGSTAPYDTPESKAKTEHSGYHFTHSKSSDKPD